MRDAVDNLSIPQVAAELGMTPAGVYKLVQRGKLDVERLSARKTRVRREALDRFTAQHRAAVDDRLAVRAVDPAVLRAQFAERHGQTPEAWIDGFKRGTIDDTPEHMDALVRAVALRETGTHAPAVTAPAEHPWAVAAFRRRSPGSAAG